MKQVQIITDIFTSELEGKVNRCLKNIQEKGYDVLDIKMRPLNSNGYFAYIVYNDKVPIDYRKLKK